MKKFKKISLMIVMVITLSLGSILFGTDNIYAAKNIFIDSSMSANGTGTYSNPYNSISSIDWSKVSSFISANNDVFINLKRGTTYFETFTFGASGTSSNKITLRAYGTGAYPIIFPATKLNADNWIHKDNGVYQYSNSSAPAFLTMKVDDKIKMLFNIRHDYNATKRNSLLLRDSDFTTNSFGSNGYGETINWWDMLKRITGYDSNNQLIYYSDQYDDDPRDDEIYFTPLNTVGINMNGNDHCVIKKMHIMGAVTGIKLTGENNIIENCYFKHGKNMIQIFKNGANNNIIRNNQFEMSYYGADETGQEMGLRQTSLQKARREHLYQFGKWIMGSGVSYCTAIRSEHGSTGNTIYNNTIKNIFNGIEIKNSTGMEISENTFHNINSCGFAAWQNCELNFHDNLMYDSNIHIRLHYMDFSNDTRIVNIYRNKIYAPLGSGFAFYVFWKNSGSAVAPCGTVRIFHNSVSGGEYGFCMDSDGYENLNSNGLPYWEIYNNIISTITPVSAPSDWNSMENGKAWTFGNNWLGGKRAYSPNWIDDNSFVAPGAYMWSVDNGEPDWTDWNYPEVMDAGIELSSILEISSSSYNGLPDIGAVEAW